MNTLREAAQQALEALEALQGSCTDSNDGTVESITVWCPEVIDALKAALAEPTGKDVLQVEPAAWRCKGEPWFDGNRWHDKFEVMEYLRAALAQPEQEPVAYRFQSPATEEWLLGLEPPVGSRWEIEPLYTHPPQRKPLTEVEIYKMFGWYAMSFVRAVERAHGIE